MRHQRCVIAAHRAWCVEQRGQQILPDIPNPCCVLLQAVHDETDMFAVQLQQLRPHDLSRVVIPCNANSEYPAISADRAVQRAEYDEQLLHRFGRA